jgi:hypothetical protein
MFHILLRGFLKLFPEVQHFIEGFFKLCPEVSHFIEGFLNLCPEVPYFIKIGQTWRSFYMKTKMSSILLSVTYVAQKETVATVSVFIILLTETYGKNGYANAPQC